MPWVSAEVPKSLRVALDQEIARLRTDESAVVTAALSKYLGIPVHTLFQVSTSGALVAGVFDREVSVKSIAKGMMIRSPEEITAVLTRALDYRNGPAIIGVHVDYSDNHKLFEMVHADSFH